jgi:hypothetical protein
MNDQLSEVYGLLISIIVLGDDDHNPDIQEITEEWHDATRIGLHVMGKAAIDAVLGHQWGQEIVNTLVGIAVFETIRDEISIERLYRLFLEALGVIEKRAIVPGAEITHIMSIYDALCQYERNWALWHTIDWDSSPPRVCNVTWREIRPVCNAYDSVIEFSPVNRDRNLLIAHAICEIYLHMGLRIKVSA